MQNRRSEAQSGASEGSKVIPSPISGTRVTDYTDVCDTARAEVLAGIAPELCAEIRATWSASWNIAAAKSA